MIFPVASRKYGIVWRVLAALALSLVARPSLADDSGWFDESAQASAPAAPVSSSRARPVPPPLEPSPLLEDSSAAADSDADDQDPEALTAFRQDLDPYGSWADDPSYGRVWVPHRHAVGEGFQPYVSGGRWALDEGDNWVWVSDYPFGHVVFHYGRWVWTSPRGWVWIPGYRYAPAWVVWRVPTGGSSYVGWAPAPPTFVWFGGVSVFWGYDPYYAWVFCPSSYVFAHHVHYHVVRDRYWMGYAARHTVPYRAPRTPTTSRGRPSSSPPLETAGVPRARVPRERLRSNNVAAPAGRRRGAAAIGAPAPTRSLGGAVRPRPLPQETQETRPAARPRADRTESRPAVRPRTETPPRTGSPGKLRRPSLGSERKLPSLHDRPRSGSSGTRPPRKR